MTDKAVTIARPYRPQWWRLLRIAVPLLVISPLAMWWIDQRFYSGICDRRYGVAAFSSILLTGFGLGLYACLRWLVHGLYTLCRSVSGWHRVLAGLSGLAFLVCVIWLFSYPFLLLGLALSGWIAKGL